MPDAAGHAAKVAAAQMRLDAAQPVMAGMAAAALDPHLGGGKVDLVVEDDDLCGRELEEAERLADRAAGLVHEGHRLEQDNALPGDGSLGNVALEAGARSRKAMAADDLVRRHETDIVPVVPVFRPGVAEPYDQPHRRSVCRERGQPSPPSPDSSSRAASASAASAPSSPSSPSVGATGGG